MTITIITTTTVIRIIVFVARVGVAAMLSHYLLLPLLLLLGH